MLQPSGGHVVGEDGKISDGCGWIASARRECLDQMLITGDGTLWGSRTLGRRS
jgi:hypothetical protein